MLFLVGILAWRNGPAATMRVSKATRADVAVTADPPPPFRGIAVPQVHSGRLASLIDFSSAVRDECRPLRFPSARQIAASRRALRLLLDGEVEAARWRYHALGFELLRWHDRGRAYWVARERPRVRGRGWGLYVVDPDARRKLVIEAPHPQHDLHTGTLAAEMMVALEARALIVATTYRCASKLSTTCAGRTGACRQAWGRGRYRRSDRAHSTKTFFHAAHVELMDGNPQLIAIQVHGFARRPARRRHIIISDGTRLPGGRRSFSNRIARAVRRLVPRRKRWRVRSCNELGRQRYLCGTANVQGRHTNGSIDSCTRAPRRSKNRFVQVELSLDARRPGGIFEPKLLTRALAKVFPARPWRAPARSLAATFDEEVGPLGPLPLPEDEHDETEVDETPQAPRRTQ